ncbi:phage regulatory CII family protein [Ectothiorhodospiraceae bacterium WFHF3C12]|nr:phage regulatory CII family protein [Ectothiorhodospiraceae bacterium WFHF3C12]
MDDLDLAIYKVVHDFPGGAPKLAPLVGMNAGTLSNKADPGMDSHQLTVRQAVAISHATKDARILHAQARALGFVCIPCGDYSGLSDLELLDSYAEWHAEIGQTAQAVRDAIADRRISAEEVRKVRRELYEDMARGFEFLARLESLQE